MNRGRPAGRRRRASVSAQASGELPAAASPLRVHALAVGQADAVVLELPSGRLVVVDFGHPLLLDYLDHLDPSRERRYAFCLLTHAHHDHYACLEAFIARHDERVEAYWFSFADAGDLPPLLALRAAITHRKRGRLLVLEDADVPRSLPIEPDVDVFGFAPTTAEVLRPPGTGSATAENARSVVLLVRYGAAAIWLGADAEEDRWERIERQALAGGIPLAADLVKAPHHGAPAPHGLPERLWPALLRSRVCPVIFSVGRLPGKPALGTIHATRAHGRIRCTGRSLTCAALPTGSPVVAAPPLAPRRRGDLIDQALRPAPETRAAPLCFGTQVYACDRDGAVTAVRALTPASLDACVMA